jgi:uncharacterized protein YukE
LTRFTVSQAQSWRPEPLAEIAEVWDRAAGALQDHADSVDAGVSAGGDSWRGAAAQAAAEAVAPTTAGLRRLCRVLVLAAAEARDAAASISAARDHLLAVLAVATGEGCPVGEDGTVGAPAGLSGLQVALAGGAQSAARALLDVRARELTRQVQDALDRLSDTEVEAGRAVDAAFAPIATPPGAVRPAGVSDTAAQVATWPTSSQDRIAAGIAAMPAAERQRLVEEHPGAVGNTDGVPWPMRIAANRINISNAILDEQRVLDRPVDEKLRAALPPTLDPAGAERMWAALHADPAMRAAAIATHDRPAQQRIASYRELLADVPDAVDRDRRIPRQILAFDPDRSSLVELSGDLGRARALGILVPGLNTTFEGSADDVATVRRFVAGSGGDVAMISYLGGRFPTGDLAAGLVDAIDPRYALEMAPRLVAFSEDVERTVGDVPVTYIGHSYGGSILGTAELFGLTADRVVYAEAAGAGVGVHAPADWHNRNPAVLRFSMTAPGDVIGLVQGFPTGPHGADPDRMPGVIPLATGRRLTGWPMVGPSTHSDVLNEPSDAWRNILAVIAGDRANIRTG